MADETVIIGILGIIGGIYKLYNDYNNDKILNNKNELLLDKEQQQHLDEMYNKIMELQRESIDNYEKYMADNKKLNEIISELRQRNLDLTNKLNNITKNDKTL